MDARFLPHNAHLQGPGLLAQLDPQLRQLQRQILVHIPRLLSELPKHTPGIYTIGGGRQVGKTTLLKQWMARLLEEGVTPARIAFFTGELIDDHHALVRLLQDQLMNMPSQGIRYILLDEVSYIKGWDKGVKFLSDAGLLEETVLVVTGSDLALIQDARMRFPGRRGRAGTVDFHLCPLSFREFVCLKDILGLKDLVDPTIVPSRSLMEILFEEFRSYMMHGGYLTAINDMARDGFISRATLNIYVDWVRGDMLKRGKQEHYLREVMTGLVKRYGSQTTWHSLARDLSIDHPKTVADYVELLARMDAVFIQPALIENKLAAAPKKARKLMFADPFIFHAVRSWLYPTPDPFESQIKPAIKDPIWSGRLAEACVATHYRRLFPTYYIKAEGEVDVAVVHQDTFWPVEVKWGGQLRSKDLKQIRKYNNARILTKALEFRTVHDIPAEPLPLALLRLREVFKTADLQTSHRRSQH
jgi:predicted AAA+ superfamily ATPase